MKPKPRLIILIGLAGCGKSTWAREQCLPTLSSDEMRGILADDVTDQTIHKQVFETLRYLIRQRIAIGRPITCVDATHLTPKERSPYFRIKGCKVEAVFFNVPLAMCHERNQSRERVVPAHVVDAMYQKLVPPSRKEGFSKITVLTPL
ncbi:MAG: AAA family ATPase [Bryobacterales bacterium]|nr:AAA family ATPase [Bryobacterales bacterium]